MPRDDRQVLVGRRTSQGEVIAACPVVQRGPYLTAIAGRVPLDRMVDRAFRASTSETMTTDEARRMVLAALGQKDEATDA